MSVFTWILLVLNAVFAPVMLAYAVANAVAGEWPTAAFDLAIAVANVINVRQMRRYLVDERERKRAYAERVAEARRFHEEWGRIQ